MCCLVPAGLGPLPLQPSPPGSPRETESTGSCLHLSLAWALSSMGTAPHLDQSCQVAARPAQHLLGGGSNLLGPTAPPPTQTPRGASADKRRRLCPRFSLSEPTLPGLTSQGTCFFQWAMLASKAHSRNQKRNKDPVHLCVPKTVAMQAQHPQDQAVA